jgi:hypothetical protein
MRDAVFIPQGIILTEPRRVGMSYRSSEYRGAKSVPEPDQQAAVTRPRRKVFQSYRAKPRRNPAAAG